MLEIMYNQSESIAEETRRILITPPYSPNTKERHDCSAALSDVDGHLVAQVEHTLVHFGAMLETADTVLNYGPEPGNMFVLNGPFEGRTHLPDATMVLSLSVNGEALGYVVLRAHHAGVDRTTPGNMPANAYGTHQEGPRLPSVRLVAGGETNDDVLPLLLANVCNPSERHADIRAQSATNEHAEE